MADLSTYASAAAARPEIFTLPTGMGLEDGDGVDVTSKVIDSGSNSDGEWVKYADGTMICWGEGATRTAARTNATPTGFYRSPNGTEDAISFPKIFSAPPHVVPGSGYSSHVAYTVSSVSVDEAIIISLAPDADTSNFDLSFGFLAIGPY